MKRLAQFFRSPIKAGHEAGAGTGRPWWKTFTSLMAVGLVSLTMLSPAQAFTSDPFNPANPMNMLNPLSPWCQVCDDPDNMSWEDHRRVDAIKIQAEEQGITDPSDEALVLDEERIADYVADRVEERDALKGTSGEERWRLEALQQQAEEQGLAGWASEGFREDRTKTRIYVEQARESQERAEQVLLWTLGGAAVIGGGIMLGGAAQSHARRREWEAEQERRRQERLQRDRKRGGNSPLI
ncbi:MAG: hypothetical protein Alpg2KO_22670 [Alphaproteobacteria bacterium]